MDTDNEVSEKVAILRRRRFWGKFTICFKGGDIYHYILREDIKPRNGKVDIHNDPAGHKVSD